MMQRANAMDYGRATGGYGEGGWEKGVVLVKHHLQESRNGEGPTQTNKNENASEKTTEFADSHGLERELQSLVPKDSKPRVGGMPVHCCVYHSA